MANKEDLEGLLQAGEVHLWWIDFLSLDVHEVRKLTGTLSSEERRKISALVFERDRLSHSLAHGFERFVLSAYAGVSPESLILSRTVTGKPVIPRDLEYSSLEFSISHGERFVGCAVSGGQECGFDIESSQRWESGDTLQAGFLAAGENAILNRAPVRDKRSLLNQLWCAKEAYLKARGLGFHTDPASIQLDFVVGPDNSIKVVGVEVDPGWSFHVDTLGKGYHMAAVSRNLGPEPARFRVMSHKADGLLGALA